LRKALELVAVVGLVLGIALTAYALYGPHPLTGRIATHFDANGQPNGWGTPAMLWFLPGVAVFIYALMTVVARFPSSFNYPFRVTPRTRPVLEGLAMQLLAWLKVELMATLAWIQWGTIRSAQEGKLALSTFFLPAVIGIVFGTIFAHFIAMRRAASA
jgi:hypothetical protein